jgi:hypothetical protein
MSQTTTETTPIEYRELFTNCGRTYASRENAIKAMQRIEDGLRHLIDVLVYCVIQHPDGRYSVLVPTSHNQKDLGIAVGWLAQNGVCVI